MALKALVVAGGRSRNDLRLVHGSISLRLAFGPEIRIEGLVEGEGRLHREGREVEARLPAAS